MSDLPFHNKYLAEGKRNITANFSDIEVESKSPSNIALIKYWGKFGNQFPGNPSVSFTLSKSQTTTHFSIKESLNKNFELDYFFNNVRNKNFEMRLKKYFDSIEQYFPFIKSLQFRIDSHNTFPHSAGIASSASAFSALAMCVCRLEKQLFDIEENYGDLLRKASFMARIGSGSACRSVYSGIVLWGETPYIQGSSNEIALDINKFAHQIFATYFDAVLVIDSSPKMLSSSEGHKLMNKHAFANARYNQAKENLNFLLSAMKTGDEPEFSRIVENEALTLHGLMLSSSPGFILFQPNTLIVIEKLQKFRINSKLQLTYTLDAGPNVHILYSLKIREKIIDFIESELKQYCEHGHWIDDKISEL